MPETDHGMEEEKDASSDRAIQLLQEVKAEHAKTSEELERRLTGLEQNHADYGGPLTEHREILAAQGQDLAHIKSEMVIVLSRLEQQTSLFAEIAQHPGRNTSRKQHPNQEKTRMSDTQGQTHEQPQLEDWRPLSWTSIVFGTLVALSISAMLHVLGLGVSASSVDTNARASDALSTIGGVTGIWFLCSTAISLFVGGFIASTLAHTFTSKRSVIYGLGVWALSTLITAAVVVPALVKGAGSAITSAGTIADRAAALLGSAGGVAAQAGQNAPSGIVENLQRSLIGTPSGQVDQSAVQDITRLLGQRFTQGDWSPQQRDQLANAVARVANISPDDARRRVGDMQITINATVEQAQEKARQAAEATRQAIATASYSAFAAMLVGLLASLFGARFGELDEDQLPAFARLRFRSSRPSPGDMAG